MPPTAPSAANAFTLQQGLVRGMVPRGMHVLPTALLLAAALVTASAAADVTTGQDSAGERGQVQEGERLFSRCAGCHEAGPLTGNSWPAFRAAIEAHPSAGGVILRLDDDELRAIHRWLETGDQNR